MIIKWIYDKLKQKAFKERHEVMKLEWQKAELEKQIAIINNSFNHIILFELLKMFLFHIISIDIIEHDSICNIDSQKR